MRLCIKQRVFSWTDSYDVYDENGVARYFVQAEFLTLGHQIQVYEKQTGKEVGSIHQRLLTFLPTFDIIVDGQSQGCVSKQFSLFTPPIRSGFPWLGCRGRPAGLGLQCLSGKLGNHEHIQAVAQLGRYVHLAVFQSSP